MDNAAKANVMGTKSIGRLLISFSIPAILGMVIVALNQIISSIYIGHGVGRDLHEDPGVPNFVGRTRGPAIREGMTLAIEPMINAGTWEVNMNGWHVVTRDGSLSAHYENTVLITGGEPEILTMGVEE